jgi:hypothetical protein
MLIDVRRWRVGLSSTLEQEIVAGLRGYSGPLALQSFDPLAVFRLQRLLGDHPVGQVSGNLVSAGRIFRFIGQTMVSNLFTRPDFVSYELSALPSPFADYWRKRIPLITFTVRSAAEEERATELAENFLFDSYMPTHYRQESGRFS